MYTSILNRCAYCARLLVIGLLCWQSTLFVTAQSLPAGFNNVKTQSGYDTPIGLIFNGQQQFVWEKGGRLMVSTWNGTQYQKQASAVLDISDEVGNWRDFGLLSVALDPNFATNGYVYLFYVVDRHHLLNFGIGSTYDATKNEYYNATISRLTRYRLVNNNGVFSTDYTSRKVLIGETKSTGIPLTHESHAGGTILFGRDGSLLLSTGDNASYSSTDKGSAAETYYQTAINDRIMTANENVGAFRAQMITSLCGKVLRIDPNTGNGLSSNPFYEAGNTRSAKSRVWALGFRNPFRMAMQPGTGSTNPTDANPGTIFVGDVGWNEREDLHVIGQGGAQNAGWPLFEGITRQADYISVARTLENKDEPNPSNTCSKPFLTFENLLIDGSSSPPTVTSPCGSTPLPGPQRRYVHSRPVLDWSHSSAIARVPSFDRLGVPSVTTISAGGIGAPFQGNCVIGGAYYPTNSASAFPVAWQNTLFFGDYGTNWIRAATFDANGAIAQIREFLPTGVGQGIVDIEYNPLDGGLYYLNINTAEVMKISYGGNRPPVAVASASSLTGTSPLSVTFTGSGSNDPDGNTITYLWDFGDGTTSTQANPTKVFTSAASRGYTVKLTVTDNGGLSDSKTLQVSLNNAAPTARITSPVNNAKYRLDQSSNYTLTASVTDESPATLAYAWQVTLRHNNHEHREPIINQPSPTVVISPVGCDGETYYYVINLTVTDAGGLTARDSVKIYPDCNSASLAVSGLSATTLTTSSVRLNWTNPTITYDNVLVVGKAGSGFTDKPDQAAYTANASFTGNGAAFYGGKVLYQGLATSLVVTELTAGQTYYFRIYTRKGTAWTGGIEVSAQTASGTVPPVSVPSVESGKCYRLVSRISGKVLGVEGNSLDNGAPALQRTDAGQLAQRWKFESVGDGFYSVAAAHSGKVLDVIWGSQDNGMGVQQYTFNGNWSYNQHWSLQRNTEGYYQLTARHSKKALEVQNGNLTEGGLVVQNTPNGSSSQQWSLEEKGCTTSPPSSTTTTPPSSTTVAPVASIDPAKCYRIQSRISGLTLSVPSGSYDDGTALKQNTNADQPWQKWRITSTSGAYYRLSVMHNSKSIEVRDNSKEDGAVLHQWTFWGGDHQQWTVQRNADGFFTMNNLNSGKAITVRNASTAEGGDIIQQTLGTGQQQQWSLIETTCPTGGRTGNTEPTVAFTLWPNPAQDHVLVNLSSVAGAPVGLLLTDLTGRALRREAVERASSEPHRFITGQLPSGLYLLRVSPAGQQPTTLRVIFQQ